VTDGGPGGPDVIDAFPTPGRLPGDCSPLSGGIVGDVLTGDIVVVDAPPLPTSKDQCKKGGWHTYGIFKNQGQCVAFVERGPKP
jgi:hypothetical protein